jgi:hypothetical protein
MQAESCEWTYHQSLNLHSVMFSVMTRTHFEDLCITPPPTASSVKADTRHKSSVKRRAYLQTMVEPRRFGAWRTKASSMACFSISAKMTMGRPPSDALALQSWSTMGSSLSLHPRIRECPDSSTSALPLRRSSIHSPMVSAPGKPHLDVTSTHDLQSGELLVQ